MSKNKIDYEKIYDKNIAEWDKRYGTLSETFNMSYSFEAMVKILWNAKGRDVNLKYIGTGFFYKYDDEPDELFRGSADEINPDEIVD